MHVLLISPSSQIRNGSIMDGVFSLRHKVFNEWLGWNLPAENGMEKDAYDARAYHFVVINNSAAVLGTWRIMPTVCPYMTREVFPELFGDREPPNDQAVWDLSRFAVDRWKLANDKAQLNRVLGALGSAVFEFTIMHGIAELLSVQDSYITPIANKFLGDPVWSGPTIDAGTTDATCYGYQPSLERLYALRTQFELKAPVLDAFQVCSSRLAA